MLAKVRGRRREATQNISAIHMGSWNHIGLREVVMKPHGGGMSVK